jgi:hypothetical protein
MIALTVVTVAAVVALVVKDILHARAIADLCQRVQAPETAIATHALQHTAQTPTHLPFDDDSAWIAYQNEMTSGDQAS